MPKTVEELEKEIASLTAIQTEYHALKSKHDGLIAEKAKLEGQLAAQGQSLVDKDKEIETIGHKLKEFTDKERKQLEEAVHAIKADYKVEGMPDIALHAFIEGHASKTEEKEKEKGKEKKPETAIHGTMPPKSPKAGETSIPAAKRFYQ